MCSLDVDNFSFASLQTDFLEQIWNEMLELTAKWAQTNIYIIDETMDVIIIRFVDEEWKYCVIDRFFSRRLLFSVCLKCVFILFVRLHMIHIDTFQWRQTFSILLTSFTFKIRLNRHLFPIEWSIEIYFTGNTLNFVASKSSKMRYELNKEDRNMRKALILWWNESGFIHETAEWIRKKKQETSATTNRFFFIQFVTEEHWTLLLWYFLSFVHLKRLRTTSAQSDIKCANLHRRKAKMLRFCLSRHMNSKWMPRK